ncbi:unnamed protein product [Closterium sp. Yama58-4]|nr:unnamed protein product [Closterium sp. Yama58-4]
MCWNGYELISLGQPKCTPATEHTPPQPGQPPVLTPVDCSQQQEFNTALYSFFTETSGGSLGVRSAGGIWGGRTERWEGVVGEPERCGLAVWADDAADI